MMASSISIPDCKMQLRIDTEFGKHYIRTKHSNLRCFPRCAVLHVEHRFCGRPIQATVIYSDEGAQSSNRDFVMVGELRNEQALPAFDLGQKCTKQVLDQMRPKLFIGQEIGRTTGETKCILPPPRKWHFPGKLRPSYRHVCQVYLITGDVIVATAVSKSFRISPVWRTDEDASSAEQETSGAHVNLRRLSGVSDVTHPPKRLQMEARDPSPDERVPILNIRRDSQAICFVESQPSLPTLARYPYIQNETKYGSQSRHMQLQPMTRLSAQTPGLSAYDPRSFNARARQGVLGSFPRVMMPPTENSHQEALMQSRSMYRPVVCVQSPYLAQPNGATCLNGVPTASPFHQIYIPTPPPSMGSSSSQTVPMRMKCPPPPTAFLFPLMHPQQNVCCPAPYPYSAPPRTG